MVDKDTLLIVESVGKITSIKKYLGCQVEASCGHIYDLPKNDINIDVENGFKPNYQIKDDPRTKATIKKLKNAVAKASNVILATDSDYEGEFIAWSLFTVLKLKDQDRITFNSITKSALLDAIKNKRKIDYDILHAQQARRLADRLFGYESSATLWRYVQPRLSSGRVQSAVVKLIVDKEKEIDDFFKKASNSYFKVDGSFFPKKKSKELMDAVLYEKTKKDTDSSDSSDSDNDSKKKKSNNDDSDSEEDIDEKNEEKNDAVTKGSKILTGEIAKLSKSTNDSEEDDEGPPKEVTKFLKNCYESEFTVVAVFNKLKLSHPGAPYMTATLQQDASSKLHFSAKQTMQLAQKLYESGLITYMRTDSISLSKEAMQHIEEYVINTYGKKYYKKKVWITREKNAQEAHEAIRPTKIDRDPKSVKISDPQQKKLYDLIWKRAVASQMEAAKFTVTNIQIVGDKIPKYFFLAKYEKIIFDGFLIVYGKENKDNVGHIPNPGDIVYMNEITATQDWTKPATRYSEATLNKQMKKLGIGRPATYATIMETIQTRGYVKVADIEGKKMPCFILKITHDDDKIKKEKKTILLGKENKRLIPTDIGQIVNKFLLKHFSHIVDSNFTAKMETKLDKIANGKLEWKTVLKEFYDSYHPKIVELKENKKDGTSLLDENSRKLGKDSDGNTILATITKFGSCVKVCDKDGKAIKYVSIEEPLTLKTITIEDAKKLLRYPFKLGKYEKKDVFLHKGQYGLYLKYDDRSYPVPQGSKEPDIDAAIDIIKEKNKSIKGSFENKKIKFTILDGQYGPYIVAVDKKNTRTTVSIPKNTDIDKLTLEDVEKIYESGMNYKKEHGSKSTSGSKKTGYAGDGKKKNPTKKRVYKKKN
jgi:DNA topoisomerase I